LIDSTRLRLPGAAGLFALALLVLALLAVAALPALAIPRYAARYQQDCGLCHVNPTGGGQRTAYAVQYLVPAEMAARSYTPEQLAALEPQISKNVSIGLDLRTIHHYADREEIPFDNFLQMQASMYLTVQLDARLLACINRGMSQTTEAYGIGYMLPFHGYVKVGRFVPAYGWRFADHTMFVRQRPLGQGRGIADLGGAPSPSTDVGMEIGAFPGRFSVTASVINGNLGATFDDNERPGYAAQALYRFTRGSVGFGLGGSVWRNHEELGRRTAAGPMGYAKLGRLTWVGEVDWSRLRLSEPEEAAGLEKTWTVSHEVGWLIRRGLELRATHDFHDPDLDVKNGSRSRYGIGLETMPWPFVVVEGKVDFHDVDAPDSEDGAQPRDYTQAQVQVHLFY